MPEGVSVFEKWSILLRQYPWDYLDKPLTLLSTTALWSFMTSPVLLRGQLADGALVGGIAGWVCCDGSGFPHVVGTAQHSGEV